jgi:pSer/pThr/pTyr-binding forkhead associated (FHA) protein
MMDQTRYVAPSGGDTARLNEWAQSRADLTVPATRPAEAFPRPRESAETAARLVVSRGPDKGAEVEITRQRTAIGRSRECDIRLNDATVSRWHAELVREHGRYFLVDGGSLNGTYLNRRPVDHAELSDGDEIWIGKARFTFRLDD